MTSLYGHGPTNLASLERFDANRLFWFLIGSFFGGSGANFKSFPFFGVLFLSVFEEIWLSATSKHFNPTQSEGMQCIFYSSFSSKAHKISSLI